MTVPDLSHRRYLADGVYAGHDGYQIWLYTNEGHRIALEPSTVGAFDRYREELTKLYAAAVSQRANPAAEPEG
jgi:hypothetical protein